MMNSHTDLICVEEEEKFPIEENATVFSIPCRSAAHEYGLRSKTREKEITHVEEIDRVVALERKFDMLLEVLSEMKLERKEERKIKEGAPVGKSPMLTHGDSGAADRCGPTSVEYKGDIITKANIENELKKFAAQARRSGMLDAKIMYELYPFMDTRLQNSFNLLPQEVQDDPDETLVMLLGRQPDMAFKEGDVQQLYSMKQGRDETLIDFLERVSTAVKRTIPAVERQEAQRREVFLSGMLPHFRMAALEQSTRTVGEILVHCIRNA